MGKSLPYVRYPSSYRRARSYPTFDEAARELFLERQAYIDFLTWYSANINRFADRLPSIGEIVDLYLEEKRGKTR